MSVSANGLGLPRSVVVIADDVRDHSYQQRGTKAIEGVMVHRVGVDAGAGIVIGYDGPSICDAFTGRNPRWASVAKATGNQNPYTFIIGGDRGPEIFDGTIWQCLPVDEIGHHARRFSARYLGVALVGDFRDQVPSARQYLAAVDLISDLCLLLGVLSRRVLGHGEVPGAHSGAKSTGQPGACPGGLLDMPTFRKATQTQMRNKLKQDAYWRLEQSGIELESLIRS